MNELEQHSRKRNIIVSGENTHSYTHTATRRPAKAPDQNSDGDDISKSSIKGKHLEDFAEERLNVFVSEIEVAAIHDDDIPKRKDALTPVIIYFFKQKLKRSEIMNDHLTPKKMNNKQRRGN